MWKTNKPKNLELWHHAYRARSESAERMRKVKNIASIRNACDVFCESSTGSNPHICTCWHRIRVARQ